MNTEHPLVSARSSILLQFDGEDSRPTGISRFGIPDDMYARFVDLGLAEHDIWTTLPAAERRFDQALVLDEYIDADAFRRTTFFNELYRPFQVGPVANSQTATGPHTNTGPTGVGARRAVRLPRRAARPTPRAQKAKPARHPCTAAVSRTP